MAAILCVITPIHIEEFTVLKIKPIKIVKITNIRLLCPRNLGYPSTATVQYQTTGWQVKYQSISNKN